jgi:DNA (cytosine-5)-methyltransferase 1
MSNKQLTAVSFFSGCGGLDLGFKQAGFKIVLANDNWDAAAESFRKNNPKTLFVKEDIRKISIKEIREKLEKEGIRKITVAIGGPPCQCFTRLNNNHLRRDDERNQLFRDYIKMIRALMPDFVVMENVSDILVRKDKNGRLFKDIIVRAFNRNGYKVEYSVFELEKYGVPQRRRRVIFIATNNKKLDIKFPKGTKNTATVGKFLKKLSGKNKLENNEITINEPDVKKRMKHIPPGGYYENLPERLKTKKVRNGKLVTVKRYGSYFRRLDSKSPAITITKNSIIHPTKNRYLTNREKAVLHTFPNKYKFAGSKEAVSQQIANSVPPEFARRIANSIVEMIN